MKTSDIAIARLGRCDSSGRVLIAILHLIISIVNGGKIVNCRTNFQKYPGVIVGERRCTALPLRNAGRAGRTRPYVNQIRTKGLNLLLRFNFGTLTNCQKYDNGSDTDNDTE